MEKIKEFLKVGSGYGSGYGYGYGYGYGSGSGSGLKAYDGQPVHYIDGVRTIIEDVNGNFAKGYIVQGDFTLEPCWIAKVEGFFAHGKNIHEAHEAATAKYTSNMPVEDRLDSFIYNHSDLDMKYSGVDLFKWHNILTGSCEMGRKQFCKDRGIDIVTASFTVEEFIRLTYTSYGGNIIRLLADRLSIKL